MKYFFVKLAYRHKEGNRLRRINRTIVRKGRQATIKKHLRVRVPVAAGRREGGEREKETEGEEIKRKE